MTATPTRFVPLHEDLEPVVETDIERALAGFLIWSDGGAEQYAGQVLPVWFTDPDCKHAVRAVRDLVRRNLSVNWRAVHETLVDHGHHRDRSDAHRLVFSGVRDGNGQWRLAPLWIDELRDQHRRRKLRLQLAAALDELAVGRPLDEIHRRLQVAA